MGWDIAEVNGWEVVITGLVACLLTGLTLWVSVKVAIAQTRASIRTAVATESRQRKREAREAEKQRAAERERESVVARKSLAAVFIQITNEYMLGAQEGDTVDRHTTSRALVFLMLRDSFADESALMRWTFEVTSRLFTMMLLARAGAPAGRAINDAVATANLIVIEWANSDRLADRFERLMKREDLGIEEFSAFDADRAWDDWVSSPE